MSESINSGKCFKFWLGIVVMFLLAAILHFVYGWSGENKLLGLFFPVNESVWEHLKILILPIILWWTIIYIIDGEKLAIDKRRWITGCLVSLLSSMLFMLSFFYTYTQAFGIESLALDILDTLLSIIFGQLLGIYFYKHSKGIPSWLGKILILLIIVVFAVFTLYPPELPIFFDKAGQKYGM